MINIVKAQMYCAQPIELIENYDKATADHTQVWHCHHVWETMLGYSKEELIEMNEYYGIPAMNLVFLTPAEHKRIHNLGERNRNFGRYYSEEERRKMNESRKGKCCGEEHFLFGKHRSEETKNKISESLKETLNKPNIKMKMREAKLGKTNTPNSKRVIQYTIEGSFVKEWPSSAEIERQLGFKRKCISKVCLGERKQAYNFIWKYKR